MSKSLDCLAELCGAVKVAVSGEFESLSDWLQYKALKLQPMAVYVPPLPLLLTMHVSGMPTCMGCETLLTPHTR